MMAADIHYVKPLAEVQTCDFFFLLFIQALNRAFLHVLFRFSAPNTSGPRNWEISEGRISEKLAHRRNSLTMGCAISCMCS